VQINVVVGEHLIENQIEIYVEVQRFKRVGCVPKVVSAFLGRPPTEREPLRGRSRDAVRAPDLLRSRFVPLFAARLVASMGAARSPPTRGGQAHGGLGADEGP